jgi:transposase InsO family protein
MSDNGTAMTAVEITEGLARLGILHEKTLPYSPYFNGKIETFWAIVEGRLMAMLEGVAVAAFFDGAGTPMTAPSDATRRPRRPPGRSTNNAQSR